MIALVNVAFYLAIARLPLGTAVAIEFVGPVAVAAIGSRRRRDIAGLALLVAGVGLLSGVHLAGNAAERRLGARGGGRWAGYIVLGHRIARDAELRPQDGLAAGLAIGALVLAPLFAWHAGHVFTNAGLLGRALARRGRLERRALRARAARDARLTRHRFAVMLALLPATATLMGLVVLGQLPVGRRRDRHRAGDRRDHPDRVAARRRAAAPTAATPARGTFRRRGGGSRTGAPSTTLRKPSGFL